MAFSKIKILKKDLRKSFEEENSEVVNTILSLEKSAVNQEATIESIMEELKDDQTINFFQYQDDGLTIEVDDLADFFEEQKVPFIYTLLAGETEVDEDEDETRTLKEGDLLSKIVFDGVTKEEVENHYNG